MADDADKQVPVPGKKMSLAPLWLGITFVGVVILSLPSVMLVFFGMMPSLVAAIIDRSPQRYSTFCVGGMNFCGVFPYLLDLWAGPADVSAAADIFTDAFAILLMYSAAGFGWLIFLAFPPVVVTLIQVMAQRRAAQCRELQKELIEEWGEDIAHPEEELGVVASQPAEQARAPA